MGIRFARHFAQLFNDMRWWRQIGVAHAEIDDVITAGTRRRPHRVDFGDDIGGQAADAVEIVVHRIGFRLGLSIGERKQKGAGAFPPPPHLG